MNKIIYIRLDIPEEPLEFFEKDAEMATDGAIDFTDCLEVAITRKIADMLVVPLDSILFQCSTNKDHI